MKKHLFAPLLVLLLAAIACSAAAQEYCTLAELREQAEAMGGRWTGTYEALGRSVPVDAPILLPEADGVPVVTVSALRPDKGAFDDVVSRGEHIERLRYVVTPEGGDTETRPGMSDVYECAFSAFYNRSLGREELVYDKVLGLSVRQGECAKTSRVDGKFYQGLQEAYTVYDYDPARSYIVDNKATPNDALRLMKSLAERFYPDAKIDMCLDNMRTNTRQYETNPQNYYRTGGQREDSYEGYYSLTLRQLLYGIPIFLPIHEYEMRAQWFSWMYGGGTWPSDPKLDSICYDKIARHGPKLGCEYRGDKAYYAALHLVGVYSVAAADVPLAPLADVIASVEALIASGNIREVRGLRLGYVLYPDEDSNAFLWAVPRWLVNCTYAEKPGTEIEIEPGEEVYWVKWMNDYDKEMLVDAQTAEAYNFPQLTRAQLTTPGFLSWDDVK